jgi:DNA-binding NarL/FixJ family response regulator
MLIDDRLAARANLPAWETLTPQELTIAALVHQAMTNQQIANRMYLSKHTVNYHLRRMFKKLNIYSRIQLAGLAQRHLTNDR